MVQLITRKEIFHKSWLADHYISNEQHISNEQRLFSDGEDEDEVFIDNGHMERTVDAFDHLQPLHKGNFVLDDFGVLAYPAKDRKDYDTNCPVALCRFYELLGIKQLYLMDVMKYDLNKFPFGIKETHDAFKQLIQFNEYCEAFELSIYDLTIILPLFYYAERHSVPIILIISAKSSLNIAMYLCDDGNFHTSFPAEERELITAVASAAGLKMGDEKICNTYYTSLLH